uniref:Peroxisomal 2,4-dienoyl-CoA reductase [(3E)-enoyl-CoA-producing] n=1 Tax=Macrostomum lignano TaxID=282301 RepID=A0A1I8F3G9_9PLAT
RLLEASEKEHHDLEKKLAELERLNRRQEKALEGAAQGWIKKNHEMEVLCEDLRWRMVDSKSGIVLGSHGAKRGADSKSAAGKSAQATKPDRRPKTSASSAASSTASTNKKTGSASRSNDHANNATATTNSNKIAAQRRRKLYVPRRQLDTQRVPNCDRDRPDRHLQLHQSAFDAWMRDHGGVIVNITATLHLAAVPGQAHAGAAKAGIDALTRHLGVEWSCRDRPVRVVAVAPRPVADTLGFDKLGGATLDRRYLVTKSEVADIVVNLLCRRDGGGAAFNAQTLVLDRAQYLAFAYFDAAFCGRLSVSWSHPVSLPLLRVPPLVSAPIDGPSSSRAASRFSTIAAISQQLVAAAQSLVNPIGPAAQLGEMLRKYANPQPLVALPSISLSTGTEQVYRVLKCVRIVRRGSHRGRAWLRA